MHDSEKDKTTQVGPGPGPALTCSSHDNPYKSKFHMNQLWISCLIAIEMQISCSAQNQNESI